jgi:hypothetical protein
MAKRGPKRQPQRPEDSEWLRRLDRISDVVDAWRKRAENPTSPEPGSSLAADSIDGLSVDNPVWYSMCISSEHLHFAIDAMRATSTMYPTAYMTVARTAFVAAVNAVWVLAPPTRQERRERALRLRADDLRVQVTSFRDMQIPEGKPEKARTGLLEQLSDRQTDLQRVATALGVQEDVTKIRFHQTGAIDWVAQHMHGVDDDLLIGATQAIWRSGSAAAHAQYHFGVMRLDRNEVVREESGGSIVRLRGDLDNDVGPAIAAATMTLNEAFRLYDLRSVVHIRR